MATEKKVKWALGTDEPDDLGDFKDNEQIVKENGGLPPKGTYTFAVKRLAVKPNKNDDDRISVMLVMKEPKKGKGAPWNGYVMWDGFNVVEGPSLRFLKAFLKALGLKWSQFLNSTKQDNQDPPHITQIGGVKFEKGEDPTVRVLIKHAPADDYNDAEHLEPQRYIPLDDDAADGDGEGEAEEEVTTVLDEPAEEKGDTLTVDMLDKMDLAELQDVAKQAGIKPKKFKDLKKKALKDLIKAETNLPPF